MDYQGIIQIISTVGFPICTAVALGFYVKYISDKNREQIEKINTQHKEEITGMQEAINNNTIAITKLTEYLTSK